MQNFKGSNPAGFKAEIRSTDSIDYRKGEKGYSLFTWKDDGSGVYLWREQHEMTWQDAYTKAVEWLNN